jgi:two-component system, cell cycle sensor histidine kinase and response regulator CckA
VNQTQSVAETIPQPIPLTSDTEPAERRTTILLVEDETLVREVMFETLVWAGYRVLKASNAAQARTAFRRCRKVVRLLLTDVVLPDQNGKELAEELRGISPDLKAILVSGYPENVMTRKAIADGMCYLPKPFSADSLVDKVRIALAQEITDIAM